MHQSNLSEKICACFNAHGFENDKPDSELEKIYGEAMDFAAKEQFEADFCNKIFQNN